jgi:hypothetical protein
MAYLYFLKQFPSLPDSNLPVNLATLSEAIAPKYRQVIHFLDCLANLFEFFESLRGQFGCFQFFYPNLLFIWINGVSLKILGHLISHFALFYQISFFT